MKVKMSHWNKRKDKDVNYLENVSEHIGVLLIVRRAKELKLPREEFNALRVVYFNDVGKSMRHVRYAFGIAPSILINAGLPYYKHHNCENRHITPSVEHIDLLLKEVERRLGEEYIDTAMAHVADILELM